MGEQWAMGYMHSLLWKWQAHKEKLCNKNLYAVKYCNIIFHINIPFINPQLNPSYT